MDAERAGLLDGYSRDTLEFSGVLDLVAHFLSGALSRPALLALAPRADRDAIQHDLDRVGEALEYARENTRPSLAAVRDPRSILEKLGIEGLSCSALEILALVDLARAARDFSLLLAGSAAGVDVGPGLQARAAALPNFRELIADLDGKILPDGSIDSSASLQLRRIRRSIEDLRARVQSALERILRRFDQDRVLQDALVTVRNERLVIPVRSEEKRRVEGVVHGASSSGATVYVEPLETVPLNNELVELQDREAAEIVRILGEFTARLRARRAELAAAVEILSEIDLAFAKAEFARHYEACLPSLGEDRVLRLVDARHPLLESTLRAQGRKPVPITLDLSPPQTLMVVSGPNTGGKTVALKTLGLAALMAQAGLPVLAAEARLPIFERVLADIGDLQSIEANLSTFSAHITNIESMVEVAGEHDLVLLDELGSSTDPQEGAALAVAILEHFRARGALTFVTTHQARLKAYASQTPQAVNAAMEFDGRTLEPTYRVLQGLPGQSSGLLIAARLGLAAPIVERARALLDPSEAETSALLSALHAKKAELELAAAAARHERIELEAERARFRRDFEVERRARLTELDKRLEATLAQHRKNWQSMLGELRRQWEAESRAAKPGKRPERRMDTLQQEARAEWNVQVLESLGVTENSRPAADLDVEAALGDTVRVPLMPLPGKVVGVASRGELEVEVGRLRLRVPKNEVRVLARAGGPGMGSREGAPKGEAPRPAAAILAGDVSTPSEINVIGRTSEEARDEVDKFLDQAFLGGRSRVRVVHGHGKNILKRSLHEMFAAHPHVDRYYAAAPNEGGSGATVVELKH